MDEKAKAAAAPARGICRKIVVERHLALLTHPLQWRTDRYCQTRTFGDGGHSFGTMSLKGNFAVESDIHTNFRSVKGIMEKKKMEREMERRIFAQ